MRAVRLPAGYRIEPLVLNLSIPTTAIFDGQDLLIAESGFLDTARPRVLRVSPAGRVAVVASEGLLGPVTGLLLVNGRLYISHRGKVSVLTGGRLQDVLTGLPSDGDHQNNNMALGPDGKIYLAQGTVTNSAVVGTDNYIFGWLRKRPTLRDVPCRDIVLLGHNFESENPLRAGGGTATTGAYKPFGTASRPGEVIPGNVKCNGSVLRFDPDGAGLDVVAWGLRNPFGLKFDRQGRLWATSHGADVRGSRNIYNDPDYLVRVQQGAWYGWPDFFAGEPATSGRFDAPGKAKPPMLWREHPPLTRPFALFGTHEGANGLAFSPGGSFGFDGHAFVAMYGSFTPVTTGANLGLFGYRIVRVDMGTGDVAPFASNTLPGPDYINRAGGFNRPSDLVFASDGTLIVVDWGASTLTTEGLKFVPQTGVLWRIFPEALPASRPQGPIVVEAVPLPEAARQPAVLNVPELYRMIALPVLILMGIALLLVAAFWLLWRR